MSDAEYGLQRSFGIDDGELEGLTHQQIFVLGYELAMIDHAIEHGESVSKPVHSANKGRIEEYARKRGRGVKFSYMHDDVSESWVHLELEPL